MFGFCLKCSQGQTWFSGINLCCVEYWHWHCFSELSGVYSWVGVLSKLQQISNKIVPPHFHILYVSSENLQLILYYRPIGSQVYLVVSMNPYSIANHPIDFVLDNYNISTKYTWHFMFSKMTDAHYLNRCVLLFVKLVNISCKGNKLWMSIENIVIKTIIWENYIDCLVLYFFKPVEVLEVHYEPQDTCTQLFKVTCCYKLYFQSTPLPLK